MVIRKYAGKHQYMYACGFIYHEIPRQVYEYVQGNINIHVTLYTKVHQDSYTSIRYAWKHQYTCNIIYQETARLL